MLSSLNLLASSATDEPPLDMRSTRIHVAIAPNPHPSPRPSELSSSVSPDTAQYRSRTRRARPLIQNKCEECVIARQKCTWTSAGDACDRCRRLDKKCRARESLIKEEEPRNLAGDRAIQANDFSGIPSSTASAALALTALSAGSEDRKIPDQAIMKRSPPYIPPMAPTNVYQIPEADYKPARQPLSRSALYFPESSLDKSASLKRKLPKKGNNPHGNVGTYKCARCRELKAKCLYTADDRPCKRCSTAGKSCGPKTLARENEAARAQADTHKPAPQRSHPWSANKPLLPRILELVGYEMASEVAAKLASELTTLHAMVAQFPEFRQPSDTTRETMQHANELVGRTSSGSQQPSVQRGSRAVSLPPNPELIHSRPEQVDVEPVRDRAEKMKIDSIVQRPEPAGERRSPADGIPQFRPVHCALDQRLPIQSARPATMTQFNQHPKAVCRTCHPSSVYWTLGCSVHGGMLDDSGKCEYCLQERRTGKLYSPIAYRETEGYPVDEIL